MEADAEKSTDGKKPSLARRARSELIEYLAIAGYLAVCFAAVLFYKAAILESEGVEAFRLGFAIVKALILGKFVLILEHLKIGKVKPVRILALNILKNALLFTVLLIILSAAEEVIAGFVHGETARAALKEFAGGTRPEALATALLMFLILLPYFAYRDIAASLGEEQLLRLLFTRQRPFEPVTAASPAGQPAADAVPEKS